MASLISSWITVLMEGETVDGRTIEGQWLDDIAETYDPDLYEASINANHFQIGLRYGRVVDVRLSESQKYNKKTLQVRIVPNKLLLALNAEKQMLHTSCELKLKFPITQKPYLMGLALTDQPASLGTDRLEFSQQSKQHLYSAPLQLEADHIPFQKDSTFNRIGTALGVDAGISAEPQDTPEAEPSTETIPMSLTKEDIKEVLKEEFAALAKANETKPQPEKDSDQSEQEALSKEDKAAPHIEFQDYSQELKTLSTQMAEMKAAVEKLSTAAPCTDFDDNTGAAEFKVI